MHIPQAHPVMVKCLTLLLVGSACSATDVEFTDASIPPAENPQAGAAQGSGGLDFQGGGSQAGDMPIMPDNGPSGGSAETPSDQGCDQAAEGFMKCDPVTMGGRLRCSGGVWQAEMPCAADEVCTMDEAPGVAICTVLDSLCAGAAGESLCSAASLVHCAADGTVVGAEACLSEGHCQAGLAGGACAQCLPEQEYRCAGATLERCQADGQSWAAVADCTSAERCDAAAGTCTAEPCTAEGALRCGEAAGSRQRCAAGVWTTAEPCTGNQSCNPADGSCRIVECDSADPAGTSCPDPGVCRARSCEDATCVSKVAEDGAACRSGVCAAGECVECVTDGHCTNASRRFCQSSTCVACRQATDCSVTGTCQVATCTGNTCGTTFAERGAACSGGVCNLLGGCVECLDDSQCRSPEPRCVLGGVCAECTSDNDCTGDDVCNTLTGTCDPNPCGNGRLDPGEACDPTFTNNWHCSQSCTLTGGSATAFTRCTSDTQCESGEMCIGVPQGEGMFCVPNLILPDPGGDCPSVFPSAFAGQAQPLPGVGGAVCIVRCDLGPCPSHTECSSGESVTFCVPK